MDLNPIKLVWHSLKDFVCKKAKTGTKQEVIQAGEAFWITRLTKDYCNNYYNYYTKFYKFLKNKWKVK